MRSRWERLGLRARITLLFALGGLLLSATIAGITLTLTRESLLDQRLDGAQAAFVTNARRVQSRLVDPEAGDGNAVLDSLTTEKGQFPLLIVGGDSFAKDGFVFNVDTIPASVEALVASGSAAHMRATVGGKPAVVSGTPLPERPGASYYEAVLLDDIESTLTALTAIILGASAATTALAAGVGAWAAGRTLTPLVRVRAAAESLAAGELDTRLEPPADADLASLAGSFNGMARSLEDRIERDARFASEVSHELRSPLMTLKASLEVLENSRDQLPERSRTALDLLSEDVARFSQLVEDLLEISRYDVGTASLQAEPIGVAEFVRQAVSHSSRPDIHVTATPRAEATVIDADKRRLGQVVANLVENADKYGGGDIDVKIDTEGDHVLIAVEDHGPGVPEGERDVIFDRFSRGSAGGRRGQAGGSGLGLSLVAEHVGLHGGRVWVEDRRDFETGARFVVAIPISATRQESHA